METFLESILILITTMTMPLGSIIGELEPSGEWRPRRRLPAISYHRQQPDWSVSYNSWENSTLISSTLFILFPINIKLLNLFEIILWTASMSVLTHFKTKPLCIMRSLICRKKTLFVHFSESFTLWKYFWKQWLRAWSLTISHIPRYIFPPPSSTPSKNRGCHPQA
jgi:hypothetical protein